METLDKSPSYFDGDKALGVPPQKRIRRPRSHAQPPPPAGRNEQWQWHCVADRSREQAQTPSCPTRRLLRGDGYSRRLSPTFPSEQVVNYYSATNGHDAVKGTSAVPPCRLYMSRRRAARPVERLAVSSILKHHRWWPRRPMSRRGDGRRPLLQAIR